MNAFLRQLSDFARQYPLAAISLVLIVLLGGADYYLWRRQAALAASSERARLEGEAMLLSLSTLPRVQGQFNTAKDALAAIDANLVSEADLAGNLDYFYQIEKTAHLRLGGISQLSSPATAADAPYRSVPFSLRLTGPYGQILAYLHELETGPRLLRVKNYRFSQNDPAADNLTLDLTVDLLGHP